MPDSWDEVILQGPHFSVATPFNKQPNENCKNNLDYSEWDLESLPEQVIPRTNYQRACDRDIYESRLDHWNGQPYTDRWRLGYRDDDATGLERSLHPATAFRRAQHMSTVSTPLLLESDRPTVVRLRALVIDCRLDYVVKVIGNGEHPGCVVVPAVPLPRFTARSALLHRGRFASTASRPTTHRSGRSCSRRRGRPTGGPIRRQPLGRWRCGQALVDGDAVAARPGSLAGPCRDRCARRLDAWVSPLEQLCAMYRTQFAVLRKYEYKMVFDAEGRKLCGYHQSAGYRQSQLQEQAKAGDLPAEWKNLWKLYEQYEADPDSVDWLGHYTAPFTRVDREAAMTRAYNEFQRRLDAGEYGEA